MGRSTQPTWLVFLVAIALVFGAYYLWQGLQSYLRAGGLGIIEATEQAEIQGTATAVRIVEQQRGPTPRPTNTPIPECKLFTVAVPNAIVRESASTNSPIVTSWQQGTQVCMVDRAAENQEWYIVDGNPQTRRIEFAYMHETVIRAVNPTPTPSDTPTPLSTVTPLPSDTPTESPTPLPTATIDRNATATPSPTQTLTPTRTPTPTAAFESA